LEIGADKKRSRVTRDRRRRRSFWMIVEGVHPDPFIYFTMYLVDLFYALRV
jgi:hypothetical protein